MSKINAKEVAEVTGFLTGALATASFIQPSLEHFVDNIYDNPDNLDEQDRLNKRGKMKVIVPVCCCAGIEFAVGTVGSVIVDLLFDN